MNLPAGHEQSEVRRWPWVSVGIAVICFASFLGTDLSELASVPDRKEYLEKAAKLWREHAYLDVDPKVVERVGEDVQPNQRKQYLALTIRKSRDWEPEGAGERAAEQTELDRLSDYATGRAPLPTIEGRHDPYTRWGYVPGEPRIRAFLTAPFVHTGWLPLLCTLLLMLLVAPALEERVGKILVVGLFFGAHTAAALFHGLITADPDLPLVGASGAIAGVVGAIGLLFWPSRIPLSIANLPPLRRIGTIDAPAWVVFPLWFAAECVRGRSDSVSPLISGSSFAYGPPIGGLIFGLCAAAALRIFRIEERWVHPGSASLFAGFPPHPSLAEAQRLRDDGDEDGAWALLQKASEEAPQDLDLIAALWDLGRACGREAEAAPAMARAIDAAVAAGELELGARQWTELTDAVPAALCDAASLIRLLPALRREVDRPELEIRALRHLVDPANHTLTPGLALRTLDFGRSVDPPSALVAATRALESTAMHKDRRSRLEEQVAEFKAAGVEPPPRLGANEIPERPDPSRTTAGAGTAGADPSCRDTSPAAVANAISPDDSFEEAVFAREGVDVDALTAREASGRFLDAKVAEATPIALDDSTLRFSLADGRSAKLPLAKIQAVAVAVVSNLGAKPVLVVDLALNWRALDNGVLRVVRLRSNGFDPRGLVGGETNTKRALKTLLQRLRAAADAAVMLPNPQAVVGRPFARFDTLDAYEREVLDIDR